MPPSVNSPYASAVVFGGTLATPGTSFARASWGTGKIVQAHLTPMRAQKAIQRLLFGVRRTRRTVVASGRRDF